MVSKAGDSCVIRYELRRLLDGPILLGPNTIEHIYNGGKLRAEFLGEPDPEDDYRSEEWIFSTNRAITPGKHNPPKKGYSKVGLDNLQLPLDLLLEEYPEETVGEKHFKKFGASLGVLMKIFDVGEGEQIPIHWHPTPEFARSHLDSPNGKNEAWIILGTRNGGTAWVGWKHKMAKEHVKTLMSPGNLAKVRGYMNEIGVEEGDVLSIPAGEVHSIGSGVCVLEPQEPTDFSIIAEWQRFQIPEEEAHLGLGWNLALDAVNLEGLSPTELSERIMPVPRAVYKEQKLGNIAEHIISQELGRYFHADRVTVKTKLGINKDGCHCLTVTQGEGCFGWEINDGVPTKEIPIRRGQSFFISEPLSLYYILTRTGSEPMQAIRCFPPPV